MGWIERKSVWLDCPYFADVLEGGEAFEGLEPSSIIVGIDEVVEVGFELLMAVVMVAFDSCLLDRSVHPFDLAIGPGMLDLGEPVLDTVLVAAEVEHVRHAGCSAGYPPNRATKNPSVPTCGKMRRWP